MDRASDGQAREAQTTDGQAGAAPLGPAGQDDPAGGGRLYYRLCPRCLRAVPNTSPERYCVNDGVPLLGACPACGSRITSPFARHCGRCGAALTFPAERPGPQHTRFGP